MSACADLRVLFRAPAGPRRGFGHLVRCRSLARALGVRPLVCVRGPRHTIDVALALGCDVVTGSATRVLRALRIDLLVVDDPEPREAARWIAAGRAAGAVVVSVHDLGLGCHDADVLIDGSIVQRLNASTKRPQQRRALGPAYAILDPRLGPPSRRRQKASRVLISLGGGPRRQLALAIADEILRRLRGVEVRVVNGFAQQQPPRPGRSHDGSTRVTLLGGVSHLAGELRQADVAVVGGGVTLYEACALGVPAVAVPVVDGQRPTVSGFVRTGAALGMVGGTRKQVVRRAAQHVVTLLRDKTLRDRVIRQGRTLVDGRGSARAARVIARAMEEH